jgi:hypothetical protein
VNGGGGAGGIGFGGGTSFGPATATSGVSNRTGDGQVMITYDPATDACPPTLIVAPRFTGNSRTSPTGFGSSWWVFALGGDQNHSMFTQQLVGGSWTGWQALGGSFAPVRGAT